MFQRLVVRQRLEFAFRDWSLHGVHRQHLVHIRRQYPHKKRLKAFHEHCTISKSVIIDTVKALSYATYNTIPKHKRSDINLPNPISHGPTPSTSPVCTSTPVYHRHSTSPNSATGRLSLVHVIFRLSLSVPGMLDASLS